MTIRKHSGLKLVPWESWQQWNHVRESVFSSSPTRVSAALSKIAAWRSRSSLPIAVEVTGDLIGIQQRDPFFSTSYPQGTSFPDEMLRLMYAMAIMRLVNGVVDQSKKQNSASVACRAEAAGLPRMLVDIRHEVAHRELPSISYLQLACKQALEWLKVQYWEAQKQALDDAHELLKSKLYAYASLVDKIQGIQSTGSQSNSLPDSKKKKDSQKELVKLVSTAVPDVVSILVDDGLLEQCTIDKGGWQCVLCELCSRVPQLVKELLSWCLSSKMDKVSRVQLVNLLVRQINEEALTRQAVVLASLSSPTVDLLSEVNKADEIGRKVPDMSDVRTAVDKQLIGCMSEDKLVELTLERSKTALAESRKGLQLLRRKNGALLCAKGVFDHEASNDKIKIVTSLSERSPKDADVDEHERNQSLKGAWSIPENWRPCAIGMLPSVLHCTGVLPLFENSDADMEMQATRVDTSEVGLPTVGEQQVAVELDTSEVGSPIDREHQAAVELDAAMGDLGIKNSEVAIILAKRKSNLVENDTPICQEIQVKRLKAENGEIPGCGEPAGMHESENQSKISSPSAHVDCAQEGRFKSEGKQKGSRLQGILLLDGMYQRCGSEQLAAIQSAIHVFK